MTTLSGAGFPACRDLSLLCLGDGNLPGEVQMMFRKFCRDSLSIVAGWRACPTGRETSVRHLSNATRSEGSS